MGRFSKTFAWIPVGKAGSWKASLVSFVCSHFQSQPWLQGSGLAASEHVVPRDGVAG